MQILLQAMKFFANAPQKERKNFKTYVNNTNSTNTTYTDLNATEAGVKYVYRVKAIRNDGTKSKKSNNAKITLSSSFYKPKNLEVNITNGAVTLHWNAPRMDSESVTGYEILRKRPTKGEKKLKTYVNNTNSTNTTYADFNATEAGVRYAYRVKALRNDSTKSKRSNFAKIDLNETLTSLQGYVTSYTAEFYEPEPTLHAQAGHSTLGPGTKASVSEGGTDLPTDNTTTGRVEVGASASATIGTATDLDWFEVELEAGTRYQIDMEGADTDRGNLSDPSIYLFNAMGTSLVYDNDGGVGKNARITYTPTASGTYFVQAVDARANEGTYTLSVIVLGATGVSEADTDFTGNTGTLGRVEVGGSATGSINTSDQQDWFNVYLEGDRTYQIDMEGAPTNRGTLEDPLIFRVRDPGGSFRGYDDNAGVGKNAKTIYTPTTDGTHSLALTSGDGGEGTYTVSVRDITPFENCDLDDEWDSSIPSPLNVKATPKMNGKVKITWKHPTRNGYSDNNYVVSHRRLWTMNGPLMEGEGKYGWQEAGTTDWANFTRVVNDNQITIDINATPGEQHAIRVHSVKETGGASACSRPKTRNFWAAKQNENDPDAVTLEEPSLEILRTYNTNTQQHVREEFVNIKVGLIEGITQYEVWRAGPDNTFTQVAGGSRCVELVEQGLKESEEYVQHCKNRIYIELFHELSTEQFINYNDNTGGMKSGKTYSYIIFPVKDNVTYYGGRWDIRHIQITECTYCDD